MRRRAYPTEKRGGAFRTNEAPTLSFSHRQRASSLRSVLGRQRWLALLALVVLVLLPCFVVLCKWKLRTDVSSRDPIIVHAFAQDETEQELLKWLASRGGYYNPKQELRYDENGLFGVFAREPIEEEEILASIPWSCVIRSEYNNGRFTNCETVKVLADELERNESLYAQGLHKALQHHRSLLPTNWSKQGKELLLKVTGIGSLPPDDPFMEDFPWKETCDQISVDATLLILTHGEEIGMVPITDKYNHRRGNYTGAYFSIEGGNDEPALEIHAYRDLQEGEQIYTDYDYVDNRGALVGTPELLRDYGFVEMYPQRYIFPSFDIAFDVVQGDNNDMLEIEWIVPAPFYHVDYDPVPSENATHFLHTELERLKQVYDDLLGVTATDTFDVPESELQVILWFCRDYKTALSLAMDDIDQLEDDGLAHSTSETNQEQM